LLADAPAKLRPGGRVLAEIDPAIAERASAAAGHDFAGHRMLRDLRGHDRVLEAWR
jgi:hypothetical protein